MKFINFKFQKIINDFLKITTFLLLGGLAYNNLRINGKFYNTNSFFTSSCSDCTPSETQPKIKNYSSRSNTTCHEIKILKNSINNELSQYQQDILKNFISRIGNLSKYQYFSNALISFSEDAYSKNFINYDFNGLNINANSFLNHSQNIEKKSIQPDRPTSSSKIAKKDEIKNYATPPGRFPSGLLGGEEGGGRTTPPGTPRTPRTPRPFQANLSPQAGSPQRTSFVRTSSSPKQSPRSPVMAASRRTSGSSSPQGGFQHRPLDSNILYSPRSDSRLSVVTPPSPRSNRSSFDTSLQAWIRPDSFSIDTTKIASMSNGDYISEKLQFKFRSAEEGVAEITITIKQEDSGVRRFNYPSLVANYPHQSSLKYEIDAHLKGLDLNLERVEIPYDVAINSTGGPIRNKLPAQPKNEETSKPLTVLVPHPPVNPGDQVFARVMDTLNTTQDMHYTMAEHAFPTHSRGTVDMPSCCETSLVRAMLNALRRTGKVFRVNISTMFHPGVKDKPLELVGFEMAEETRRAVNDLILKEPKYASLNENKSSYKDSAQVDETYKVLNATQATDFFQDGLTKKHPKMLPESELKACLAEYNLKRSRNLLSDQERNLYATQSGVSPVTKLVPMVSEIIKRQTIFSQIGRLLLSEIDDAHTYIATSLHELRQQESIATAICNKAVKDYELAWQTKRLPGNLSLKEHKEQQVKEARKAIEIFEEKFHHQFDYPAPQSPSKMTFTLEPEDKIRLQKKLALHSSLKDFNYKLKL